MRNIDKVKRSTYVLHIIVFPYIHSALFRHYK